MKTASGSPVNVGSAEQPRWVTFESDGACRCQAFLDPWGNVTEHPRSSCASPQDTE